MCDKHRRQFLGQLGIGGLLLTPLAVVVSGCKKDNWPDGMAEIKWDRDTCTRCSMVISDRRFACQVRGGPDNAVFKFDDPGCLAFWLKEKAEKYPWLADAATKIWIADFNSKSREEMHWLDPKRAYFIGKTSPMGYNFAAVSMPMPGSLDFTDMRQHVLAKGK